MPIERVGLFYQSHDLSKSQELSIGIESEHLSECLSFIKRESIRSIFGSPHFGFKENNLDFLSDIPEVERVWFWDVNLKDVSNLYKLRNLKYFGIHPKRPALDFSNLPNLESVVIEPKSKDCGLSSRSKLKLLHVWHFPPKGGSFWDFEMPTSINELQINWSSIDSLSSLPALEKLQRLEIHRCRNLKTLQGLESKYPNLRHLVINTCGNVNSNEAEQVISSLTKLEHAYVQNKNWSECVSGREHR